MEIPKTKNYYLVVFHNGYDWAVFDMYPSAREADIDVRERGQFWDDCEYKVVVVPIAEPEGKHGTPR